MKPRTAFHLAWTTCVLTLAIISGILVLTALNSAGMHNAAFSIVGIASSVVGSVVASRRPANPVGWLFLAGALISAARGLSVEYAVYGLVTDPGAVPFPLTVGWFSHTIEFLGPVVTFILVPLYFPTGKPVSWRWGVIAWLVFGMLPVATISSAISPGTIIAGMDIQNPLVYEAPDAIESLVGSLLFVWYIGLMVAATISLIVRFRRSWGVERQQIKWFTYAAAFIPVWFMTNSPVEDAFPFLFQFIDSLIIAAVPVAAGLAILRYRLYDIDVIINRTLVYAVLTATLVLLYLGGVVLLQTGFHAVTGGDSQLAVVASTLAIAALFSPLRRLIQTFIDRRFYRKKYDARETLEAFGARLRDETDLDSLSDDLVSVAGETMQPEHVSLWLRKPEAGDEERR